MPSVVILTGSHLCHNPRVMKEAAALAEAGYDVKVLGGWLESELKARDRELMRHLAYQYLPVMDLTLNTLTGRLSNLGRRVRSKFAAQWHARLGRESVFQLGYCISALRRAARRCPADLYIAHSEPALAVALDLWRAGRKVGVDLEDWFSEDLLPEARSRRPVKLLRGLEMGMLRNASQTTCTSQAMSAELVREFGCRPPVSIYNAFSWAERKGLDGQHKDRKNSAVPSIHWYSQTLGYGRGLEELFAALPLLKHDVEIHLRGRAVSGFEQWLDAQVPARWRRRIFLHPLVANDQLLARIAEHDIGFAGELKYCRSRDLTITNKILHYLLGGLAVVASDTAGHREVAGQAGEAVRIYPAENPVALAEELNALLASPETLRAARAAALQAAEKIFCWEQTTAALLQSVAAALARAPQKKRE